VRIIVVVSLFLLAFAAGAPAGVLNGNIITDKILTLAESPWLVTSNVEVRFGATLTVEPGVEVLFYGPYRIVTDGDAANAIVAIGTPADSIVFKSANPNPGPEDWEWIEVFNSSGSAFRHCIFRHADQTLRISNCSPAVEFCTFRENKTNIWCVNADPLIQSCTITDWAFVGIFLQSGSSPTIRECNIFRGRSGTRQGESIYLSIYNPPTMVTIDATRNWWGTTDLGEIEDSIYHGVDTTDLWGIVDFAPPLEEVPVENVSWGAIKLLFKD